MTRRIIGVVLAAGASRRFGPRDKLGVRVAGKPLVQHPARALRGLGLARRAAVVRDARHPAALRGAGLDVWPVGHRRAQSASLHRAVRGARAAGASHVLILLGDMPGLTRADLRAVLNAPGLRPAMARAGGRLRPPALIPRRLFAPLMRLRGDAGAGALLRRQPNLRAIRLATAAGRDIDRPHDLR